MLLHRGRNLLKGQYKFKQYYYIVFHIISFLGISCENIVVEGLLWNIYIYQVIDFFKFILQTEVKQCTFN